MSNKKLKKQRLKHPTEEEVTPLIETNLNLTFNLRQKFPLSDTQRDFIKKLLSPDTSVVFCDGPAGTSKSYCAVYAGLMLLKEKKVSKITYIRSIVESASKKMGSLPGEVDEKFAPWMQPLLEKCDELIGPSNTSNLLAGGLINCKPVNFLRGTTFSNSFTIIDECQNIDLDEIVTIFTRLGQDSKLIFLGDSFQSDIRRLDFKKVYELYMDAIAKEKGFATHLFTLDDCKRHPLLKFILERLQTIKLNARN